MPKFLVETVSMFRMRYVVDCSCEGLARDVVSMNEVNEFGQTHIAENIISSREIQESEVVDLFLEDHSYLADYPERAFDHIHKISY